MNRRRPMRTIVALALVLLALPATTLIHSQSNRARPTSTGTTGRPATMTQRVFAIRFKTVDAVYLLVSPLLGPKGSIRARPHQRTLSVTDAPENLRRIAEAIASFDLPPRSVNVAVQLILASSGEGSPEPTPPPIRGVIEKLSALSTRWNDYRLVGNARVRGTEGEFSSLKVGDDYRVSFRVDDISELGGWKSRSEFRCR